MKIDEVFTSKFLRAADIDNIADETTQTAIVIIEDVLMEEIGADQQQKPVVFFQSIKPGLVLNKTNANTLKGLLGNDTDDWKGKAIGLFTTEVDFQGQQVLSIRVRMRLPKLTKGKIAEDVAIPF